MKRAFLMSVILIASQFRISYGEVEAGVKIKGAETIEVGADIQQFGQRYNAALLSKSYEDFQSLLHPKSKACINNSNEFYFKDVFEKKVARHEGADASKITQFLVLPENYAEQLKSMLDKKGLYLPIEPTHSLYMTAQKPSSDTKKINGVGEVPVQKSVSDWLLLAKSNGNFYVVESCPDPTRLSEIQERVTKGQK